MKGVLFSVEIIGIDPYRSLRAIGKGLLGFANSFPMRVFDPILVPSPVETTVAKPADDEVEVGALQVLFQLLFQAIETGEVDVAVLGFGVGFSLHPYESYRPDLFAVNLGLGSSHHGIVYLTCVRVGLSFAAFPFLIPFGNRLSTLGMEAHDDVVGAQCVADSRGKP